MLEDTRLMIATRIRGAVTQLACSACATRPFSVSHGGMLGFTEERGGSPRVCLKLKRVFDRRRSTAVSSADYNINDGYS